MQRRLRLFKNVVDVIVRAEGTPGGLLGGAVAGALDAGLDVHLAAIDRRGAEQLGIILENIRTNGCG